MRHTVTFCHKQRDVEALIVSICQPWQELVNLVPSGRSEVNEKQKNDVEDDRVQPRDFAHDQILQFGDPVKNVKNQGLKWKGSSWSAFSHYLKTENA